MNKLPVTEETRKALLDWVRDEIFCHEKMCDSMDFDSSEAEIAAWELHDLAALRLRQIFYILQESYGRDVEALDEKDN